MRVGWAWLVVAAWPACSGLATIEGGYQQPYDEALAPGHRGLSLDLHYGMGPAEVPVGVEAALRTKHGADQQQWGLALAGFAFTPPAPVGVFGRAGLNLVQLEDWSGELAFGAGSPFVQAGFYLLPAALGDDPIARFAGVVFLVSGLTGYDVRFGDAPGTGWWAVTAGIGFVQLWDLDL